MAPVSSPIIASLSSRRIALATAVLFFVTLRSREPLDRFKARVAALAGQLEREGWPLLKQDTEICLHDSRESLDAGWLEAAA